MAEDDEADAAAGSSSTKAASCTTTMRQKLKHADQGKNVWPQHFPKLQGVERRDAAHLRASGLMIMSSSGNNNNNKKKKQKTKKASDDNNNDKVDDTTLMLFGHLGRALGGPDAVLRHQAVLKLEKYLKARCETTGLSELDLLKISKCLWYTLYLADRQVVQAELSKIIARLVIETLAGTEEEDEYAAALYLRACEAAEQAEEDDLLLDDGDDIMELDDDDDEENVVDEEAFPIEEPDSEDENVDYLAKQMEIMAEDDDDDEDDKSGEASSAQPMADELEDEDNEEAQDGISSSNSNSNATATEDDPDEDPVNAPHGRGAHLAALFFRTFLRTILQHWATMDKYRIDKFYTMLRYMMERMYGYCASRGWNAGMIRLFNDGLCDEVLCKVPNGVRCHLIDVCLDELVKHEMDVTEAVFLDVVQPFFSMAQTGVDGDDLVHTRAVENVLERFLDKYSIFANATNQDDGTTNPRFQQVHVGTVAQFIFEMAADDETTRPRYRARLYEVFKKYTKCIRMNGEENDVDIARTGLCLLADDNEVEEDDAAEENVEPQNKESGPESNPVVEVNEEPKLKSKKTKKSSHMVKNDAVEARAAGTASKQKSVEAAEKPEPKSTTQNDQTAKHASTDADTSEKALSKREKKRMKKQKRSGDGETQLASFKGRAQQGTVISDEWKSLIESSISGKVSKMDTENEIMITMEEQRNAKAMMKKKGQQQQSDNGKVAKKRQREQSEKMSDSEKKVKFGNHNIAKSHEASMKDLRQASPPAGARPDKGILKNKHKIASTKAMAMKQKGRGRRG